MAPSTDCRLTRLLMFEAVPNSSASIRDTRDIWSLGGMMSEIILVPLLQAHTGRIDHIHRYTTTTVSRPFFRDHPGELVPEENLVQGKINRGRHTDHLAGHSIRTNQCPPPPSPPFFLQARCPSCRPTNSVKALKATSN